MKKISLIILTCILSTTAIFAQQNTNDTDFFKAIFGVDKITAVKEFITVADENNLVFWDTYQQYESNRIALRSQRIALITDYAENYLNFSDGKIEDLAKRSLKLNKKNTKNIEKYFKKLKKAGGAKAAAQFLQIENYLLSLSKVAIYENIPFIGELERVE